MTERRMKSLYLHNLHSAPPKLFVALALVALLAACSSGLTPDAPPTPLETLASTTTVQVRVATGSDDARQVGTQMQLSSSSLEFSSQGLTGVRFQNVNIPPGARIARAYIEFKAAAASSGSLEVNLRGVPVNNADPIVGSRNNLSLRRQTSASSTWRPNAWRVGQTTRTSELAGVVQEIVDLSGWRSGNALVFVARGSGGARRQAVAFEGNRLDAPTLYVTFETRGGDGGPTPSPTPPNGSVRTWQSRLVATIDNPQYGSGNGWMNPVNQASSGDLYVYGYQLNHYMTSLMLAYRETGDRKLVAQMDSLMNRAKAQLKDYNRDGYRNWRFLNKNADSSSRGAYGTDNHEMTEMMTHSMVAAAAYTFRQAGFSSSASFWTSYLKNDFEAKWRKRKRKSSGFPFLNKTLMHPYSQFIRYHYYMGKLTGDGAYTNEARRMAGVVKNNMRTTSTSGGTGYQWDHRVQLSGRASSGCQPMVYARLTMQSMADMATQDSGIFDRTFMQRIANTMAHKGLKNADGSQLAGNICGSGSYGNLYNFVSFPYSQVARWDSSGRLRTATERAYNATERNRLESPRIYNLPAMMVFSLGR